MEHFEILDGSRPSIKEILEISSESDKTNERDKIC
jgi:hypothetical protein